MSVRIQYMGQIDLFENYSYLMGILDIMEWGEVLDCDIVVSEFELQLLDYIHFCY